MRTTCYSVLWLLALVPVSHAQTYPTPCTAESCPKVYPQVSATHSQLNKYHVIEVEITVGDGEQVYFELIACNAGEATCVMPGSYENGSVIYSNNTTYQGRNAHILWEHSGKGAYWVVSH